MFRSGNISGTKMEKYFSKSFQYIYNVNCQERYTQVIIKLKVLTTNLLNCSMMFCSYNSSEAAFKKRFSLYIYNVKWKSTTKVIIEFK